MLYAFLAPLGNLARFGSEENSLGMMTIVLIVIVAMGFHAALPQLGRNRIFFALTLLVFWLIVMSIFAPTPLDTFTRGLVLIIYLLSAATAYRFMRCEQKITYLIIIFCFGGLVSSTVSLVDYFGLLDIPRVNEHNRSTYTDFGVFLQMSGPFNRRTSMATYYTMVISMGFVAALLLRKIFIYQRVLLRTAAISCFLVLALTHNRGGTLAAILATVFVLAVSTRSLTRLIKVVLFTLASIVVIGIIILRWFPDLLLVYQALLPKNIFSPLDYTMSESDRLRIVFFQYALQSILYNPLGHGFSLLAGVEGYEGTLVDPHSIISQIIWGAGLFGLGWLIYFGSILVIHSRLLIKYRTNNQTYHDLGLVLLTGLIAFTLTGMTHTIISTGIAWIFFGAYLSVITRLQLTIRQIVQPSQSLSN